MMKNNLKCLKSLKCLNKLISLMMVFFLTFGLFSPLVHAANLSEKGTITVSGIDVVDNKTVTVSAYRLMNVNVDTDKNQPVDPVYSWVDKVQAWVDANYPLYSDANEFNVVKVAENNTDVAEFYDKLAAAIRTEGFGLPEAKTRTGNGTITDLEMGAYLILIENGMKVYRPSAVNVVPTYNETTSSWEIATPTVEIKSSPATIVKEVSKNNVKIGEKVSYTVTTDVPNYPENAKNKKYMISDKLSEGLTFNDDIVVKGVKGETKTDLTLDTHYTKNTTDATLATDATKKVTFQLNFDYSKIKEYDKLEVTYSAVINEKAVLGKAGNNNEAYLEYSNNPYGTKDFHTEGSQTIPVFTYGLALTKVDAKETTKTLAGAKFELALTNAKGYTAIEFVKLADGHYRLAADTDATKTTELVVNASGELKIDGLEANTYYLWETEAPGGYNKPSTPFTLTITDTNKDGVIEDGETLIENGYLAKNIENKRGFNLPSTGGMGTILFTLGGIVLMGLGLILISHRKNS